VAIIQVGPIVSDISGSIGGSTFQQSTGGLIVRTKPISNKVMTPPRSLSVQSLSMMRVFWLQNTAEQQLAWKAFGKDHPLPNGHGGYKHLSAYSWFTRVNNKVFKYTSSVVRDPPVDLNVPSLDSVNLNVVAGVPGTFQIFGNASGFLSNCYLNVWVSRYQKHGKYAFYGPYKALNQGFIALDSWTSILTKFEALFKYKQVPAQTTIYVKAEILNYSNGVTSPFQYANITTLL
jgi:hypothetical protein